jgi:hypothetical protein
MLDDLPPEPGPRPAEFEFTFAGANRALAAIEDLIARYRAVVSNHHRAANYARVDFEGETRKLFDRELDAALDSCNVIIRELEAQRDQLERLVHNATTQGAERQAEIQDWERQRSEYLNAKAPR